MKILMTTNDKVFILRGRRIADIGLNRKVGGEIYSNMFEKMAPPFKSYTDSLWAKYKSWN